MDHEWFLEGYVMHIMQEWNKNLKNEITTTRYDVIITSYSQIIIYDNGLSPDIRDGEWIFN